MSSMPDIFEALKDRLWQFAPDGVALAYSGGVDSTLLLAVLAGMQKEKPFPFWAVTVRSVFQTENEWEDARSNVAGFEVNWQMICYDPLHCPEIKNNPVDRCYWCKRHFFRKIFSFAEEKQLGWVMDGTNYDDLHVYRPGRKALHELGVISPLASLGITKNDIRALAAELKLKCALKPAAPCMATRFPYGAELTEEAIERVVQGEGLLRKMFPEVSNLRLRVQESIARIEVDREWVPALAAAASTVTEGLKALGFQYITLDLEGFRSGSMDIGLAMNGKEFSK